MNSDWLTAFEALKAVYCEEAYSNMAINEALAKHKECSQSFVRMFVKGVIRDTIRLDYYIDRLAAKGTKGIKKRPLIILRMGIYAIRELGSVPEHAACNEAVALAKKVSKGTDRFINGMLRGYIRNRAEIELPTLSADNQGNGYLDEEQISLASLLWSMDRSIVSLINRQYGAEEAVRILDAFACPPPLTIRCNLSRIGRDELIEALRTEGVSAEACSDSRTAVIVDGGNVTSGRLFRDGLFSIQSLSSIKSIEAFSPAEGSRVLDMCAAPGGKTAAMAELMRNMGSIVSCELHEHRVALIDATASRLGIDIVSTRQMDACVHEKEYEGAFDYVLCDVPCSGLGVIATKPEIKLRAADGLDGLVEIQRRILRNGISYLRDGGYIMYSTCTINRDENEGVVSSVLETEPDLGIVENMTFMPYNDMIGFYYCIMKKDSGKGARQQQTG